MCCALFLQYYVDIESSDRRLVFIILSVIFMTLWGAFLSTWVVFKVKKGHMEPG